MKIIITKTFEQNFTKDFKKYNFDLNTFILILKKTKQIHLKSPYIKVKIFLNKIAIRGIIIKNNLGNIIPIFIILKNDKNIGNNLILNKKVLEKINNLMLKMTEDFKKMNYKSY